MIHTFIATVLYSLATPATYKVMATGTAAAIKTAVGIGAGLVIAHWMGE